MNAGIPNTPPHSIRVARHELGPFATNCYILWHEGSPECWIIDASYEPIDMIDDLRRRGLTPTRLLLTHAHCDHIAGIAEVCRAFSPRPRVAVHTLEAAWLGDPELNLSIGLGEPLSMPDADETLDDGQALTLDGSTFRVLHVPGHSPGSVAFYCAEANLLLGGDALFAGSIGRTDFPGCSHETLLHSIRTRLYTLPPATRVLPGHGPETTIGREMKSNPFVRV